MIAFFTPFITGAIDFKYGYVFAACNFLGGLIVYFFLVEGQGRTLEEIDTMYIERVAPRKSAKWIAPSADEMAKIRKEAGTDDTAGIDINNAQDIEARGTLSGETERGGEGAFKKAEEENAQHQESIIR